jgi:O-acetylserine/cysteine efflux transporter
MAASLSLSHVLLALAVVAIWGSNFVVIRAGLDHWPPLLFAALRFGFAAFPALLILPRPAVPWRHLVAYGLLIGVGQFGLIYIAMNGFISPGLTSLVIQVQVFFTIGLSVLLAGERVRPFQVVALGLATAGIAIIAAHVDRTTTPLGLALVLVAALCWAAGNMVVRRGGRVGMVAYVAWSSAVAVPPLLVLSALTEGASTWLPALRDADAAAWGAALWQSVGNSLFGYAAWGYLLNRYPAATVTPWALLVPVFGIASSALILGEPLPVWKLAAAGLVIAGLALGVAWPLVAARRAALSR